jgi:tRNA-dihydrouridine synthase
MSLLYRVERHLKQSGVPATVFGRAAINDPALVRQLRNGREPRAKTEARILAAIAAAECAREGIR